MPPDARRAFDFQRLMLDRTSTRTLPLPWGTAFYNDDFPLRYDSNTAIVDRPLGAATADDVVATLDEAFDGYRHREVQLSSVDDADAIAMGMAEHGFAIERLLVMAHLREPDRAPDLSAPDEIDAGAMRPFRIESTAREPWGTEPEVQATLADFLALLADRVGARFFGQRIDGELAGACELYIDGDVAQVENVDTLEEYRQRGVARNVVLRAVQEARAAGATFVFLFADADDWPRHLYARLGFDEIGQGRLFTRWPERDRRSTA